MRIYWIILLVSLGIFIWYEFRFQTISYCGIVERRPYPIQGIVFFGMLTILCGLRSGIADTGTYIYMFESYPSNISLIEWESVDIDKGFYFLTVLYKQFISDDFHGWLFIFTLISCIALYIGFEKYAEEFGMACFLFIASTIFVYLVNGMRQFLCVSIIFACSGWIAEKKYLRFVVIVLLLSTIHASVFVFIPLCFVINSKAWSFQMLMIIIASSIVGLRFDSLIPYLGVVIKDTQYAGYIDYFSKSGVGSSIFRLAIAIVPCVLAFMGKKIIEKEGSPLINLMINMSLINACLYFIATFSSGMLVGRMTTYFDIYNVLLLPWLIQHVFEKKSAAIIRIACMIFYFIFFYYQMVITWNLPYESDILNLFYYQ